jgi:hypothetical protein
MKILLIIVVFLFLGNTHTFSQIYTCDTALLIKNIAFLASDSLKGRKAGSAEEIIASEYIAKQFKKAGIKPFKKCNYFQSFIWKEDSVEYKSRNIIACINNKSDTYIIIGAHYDHLGMGGKASRSYGKTAVHNGADDNASGIALLMELSNFINKCKNQKHNFIFIAYSAHEPGLFGSRFFVESLNLSPKNIVLSINLDMLGRADYDTPTLLYATQDIEIDSIINSLNQNTILNLRKKEIAPGDHTAYEIEGIPILFLTTGIHDDYHKVSDKFELINFEGMCEISSFIQEFIFKHCCPIKTF